MTSKAKKPTGVKHEMSGPQELLAATDQGMVPVPNEPAPSAASRMLAVIDKAATDTRTNVEKMRALLDMQMELIREERRVVYSNAMKEAQAEMEPVVRKSYNEHTKSHFAKLEHIDKAIRPIYTKHGFSLSFNSRKEADGTVTILCDVLHDSGHSEHKELNGDVDIAGAKGNANKSKIQGVGSTVSFLRRYLTCMVFNITLINEDDDGTGAKLEKGKDPFANKLKDKVIEPTYEEQLITEAGKVKEAMAKKPDLEARGALLMRNVQLIKQLEEAGMDQLVSEIRAIAEGVANA